MHMSLLLGCGSNAVIDTNIFFSYLFFFLLLFYRISLFLLPAVGLECLQAY